MGLRAIIADLIIDATTAGKALLTAANAAAQRTLLGLGTSAVRDEGYFAIADTHAHTVINLDGTSIVDMDGNGNTRLTTAASKGIVLAPLNDTVSIIRGTAQPQTWQIANTWSASDDFELLRLSANTTEYRIMSIPGASAGSNRPIKIGHSDGAGSFTAAVTVNINGTVTFPSSISASNLSGTNTGDQDLSSYATTAAVAAGYQPLDSDLTAIAALTTTSFGRGALEAANAGAFRTYIGAGTGTSNFDGAYSSLSGIPSTFAPSSHTHPLSEISQSAATNNQVPQWNGSAWVPVTLSAGSGDALVANPLSQFAATTSSQLAGVISDETGTGLLPFATGATHSNMTVDHITLNETLGSDMVVDGAFAAPTQYTCATAGVNTTNDTFTLSSNPGWSVNDVVQYHNGGGTTATGMTNRGFYYIESYSAGVMSVKTTTGGAKVNLTGTGNNAQFFIKPNWFAGTSGTTGAIDGWDLSAGGAAKVANGTPTLRPVTALVPTIGQLYKVQYTVSNWTVAGTTLVFGGVTVQDSTFPTGNGTYTTYLTAVTAGDLSLAPLSGMRATISGLSIRPVTSGLAAAAIPYNATRTLSSAFAHETGYVFNVTVNKAGGDDTGFLINMDDVSSPGTTIIFGVATNGTSRFTVNHLGTITCNSIVNAAGYTGTTMSLSNTWTSTFNATASMSPMRTSGTLLTGGTGTTNFPQFLQQPTAATAATTWSTAGTWHGINTASGFTGNFFDFRINGASPVFVVDSLGAVAASGGITPRITSVTSSSTPTPNFQTADQYNVTALAVDATFGAPTGTLSDGMSRFIRIKDNGTARALSWNAAYRAINVTLPTTTVINKTLYLGMKYNSADSKWDVLAVGQEA